MSGSTSVGNSLTERIGAHSHIRGLGLTDELQPESREGMVGQERARRAAGIVYRLICDGKLAGRAILIAGKPATGKTALATAISQSLGKDTPFTSTSSSEFFSLDINRTEALTQALRRSISVRIREETELIEGEVAQINIKDDTTTGEKMGEIVLKTLDMESSFDIGAKMIEQLTKETVTVGDIISIDKITGRLTKVGRSFSCAEKYDAMGSQTKLLQPPTGELITRREVEHDVTLHDMDVINSRSQGFLALFNGDTGEISIEVREQVDQKIAAWKEEGKATVIPGVLFIDESHMLNIECYSFLNRALESELSPIIIFATNRGIAQIRGTEYQSPFAMPTDLLDRLLIIHTEAFTEDQIREILIVRGEQEGVEFDDMAIDFLSKVGFETSLRYAIQLITTSHIIAQRRQSHQVVLEDCQHAYELFMDLDRSCEFLASYGAMFSFNEVTMGNVVGGGASAPAPVAQQVEQVAPRPVRKAAIVLGEDEA